MTGVVFQIIFDRQTKFSWSAFPSWQRRGGRAIHKMDPFRTRRGRGGQFGEIFRPEHFAGLTTPAFGHPSSVRRGILGILVVPRYKYVP